MILLKRTLQFFIICSFLGLITLVGLYYYVKPDIPSVQVLKDVQLQTPMQVFSRDGLLINQFGEKRRIPVKISDIPQPFIDAILATEDNRFYEHIGIDPIGIIRSAIVLISTGEKKQGASTITMQLARNFFLTREKAYIRKVKEIFIALHIESILSKDEILELYLNKIELGNRAFGIGAAAQVYYGKDLNELNLAQMAMIAGLPKAPSALNPIRNPERAKARRNVVLGRMYTEKYITHEQFKQATSEPITAKFHGAEIDIYAPYISEMVRAEMVARYGAERAYNTGFKVFTSVEAKVQKAAQDALVTNLHNYDMRHGYRGAVATLWDPEQDQPLTTAEIVSKLKSVNEIGPLLAGVVSQVSEQAAQVILKNGNLVSIEWDGLKWARKYITRYRQGFAPTTAVEILKPGEQIWLRRNQDNSYVLSQVPEASSALVSLDPQDGRIKAIVGGYSFEQSQYNRAVQAKRQVGSNIKPFIYSAALENGYTLASILNDAPINQWDKSQGVAWRPKNSPAVYNGPIRIRRALAQSKNVISVRLLRGVGLQRTADHLLKFGFLDKDINRSESLALGSASITPLELARGMSAFANGGHLISPYFITEIQDSDGNSLYKADPLLACDPEPSAVSNNEFAQVSLQNNTDITNNIEQPQSAVKCAPRIISKQNAFLISQAMHSAIWGGGSWTHKTGWSGTGWRAQALDRRDLYGKTGTTNDSVDTWFSGFNQHVMTSVWVGFDNPGNPLGRSTYNKNLDKSQISGAESGAKTAQPAWVDFMRVALEGMPEAPIEPPEDLVSVRIDLTTGLLSHKNDYTSRFEYFEKGTAPTKYVLQQSENVFEAEQPALKTEEELF